MSDISKDISFQGRFTFEYGLIEVKDNRTLLLVSNNIEPFKYLFSRKELAGKLYQNVGFIPGSTLHFDADKIIWMLLSKDDNIEFNINDKDTFNSLHAIEKQLIQSGDTDEFQLRTFVPQVKGIFSSKDKNEPEKSLLEPTKKEVFLMSSLSVRSEKYITGSHMIEILDDEFMTTYSSFPKEMILI